jgi:DNA helicase-2/ATP-dependent DNA helicase PcrA
VNIDINTYHGFIWRILRSHAYLLNGIDFISLLPPPEAASRLADISGKEARDAEKRRLFDEEGLLHFDQFAPICAELLSRSSALREIISDSYPIIILDEFQDTNEEEWKLIQELAKSSEIIALADPDQRIYEFRGADPKRLTEFLHKLDTEQFDFGTENNRSSGTDIVTYGNDLLAGSNREKEYNDVRVKKYPFRQGNALHADLKVCVLNRISALRKTNAGVWSLTVLVPTKSLMLQVSDYLAEEQLFGGGKSLPKVVHEVALETAGPSLAAKIIASLLEGQGTEEELLKGLVRNVCEYIRGRKGDKQPTKADRELSAALLKHVNNGEVIRGKKRIEIVDDCKRICAERQTMELTGNPGDDWLLIRRKIGESESECLINISTDARYLRLLQRGALLRSSLGDLWRSKGSYVGAAQEVHEALIQEHFSSTTRTWKGVHIMTMHKAKGKEFSEVIIYEGATRYRDRIVRDNADDTSIAQCRLLLRVAVTRAMQRTHILTPARNSCPLV